MTKAAGSRERGADVGPERSWRLLSFCIAGLLKAISTDCLRSSTTTNDLIARTVAVAGIIPSVVLNAFCNGHGRPSGEAYNFQ
jgi:hypothetical protein